MRTRGVQYLTLVGIAALILVIYVVSRQPYGLSINWLIRGTGALGYLFVFLSVLSSAYVKQVSRVFGRPFVKVHHVLSLVGLILVTLHPLGVALQSRDVGVFLPRFDSWRVFFQLGGRPAWYFIAAASLAAVLRKTIGRGWRVLHYLNYVAFLLGTVHGIMIGTDFHSSIVRAASIALSIVVVVVFTQKRLRRRRR
jgi:sulfoxide reductase heme-binding subunit YedZ